MNILRKRKLMYWTALMLLVLAACGGAAEEPAPAQPADEGEPAQEADEAAMEEGEEAAAGDESDAEFVEVTPEMLLFSDDFSDENSGWDRTSYDGGVLGYTESGYRISITLPNNLFWANPGQNFEDVIVEVDAQLTAGGEDNAFGVICRYQDAENFYALMVGSDGDYAIRKRVAGSDSLEIISGDELGSSEAVLAGNEVNHVKAECLGDELKLYVNDELLAEVTDADISAGDVGLIAGTFESPEAEVLFTDFEVYTTP